MDRCRRGAVRRAGGRAGVEFHVWLQSLLALQLKRFASGVVASAVGVAPDGADDGCPPSVVPNVTIGAPPDALNAAGQNWGMAPLHPAAAHRRLPTFVRLLRAAVHGAAGIRVDHVLGLFRLWFVPSGGGPADGAYVRYPADDLLAVLALESDRAGCP